MIQAIIFDVDGTLWNTTDYVADAWTRAGKEICGIQSPVFTGEDLRREFGKPMDIIANDLFPEESKEVRERILDLCKMYEKDVLENIQTSLLYPYVSETIRELGKTYKIFIVSNCQSGYIPLFLKRNALEDCVEDFECYGDTHLSKGENIRLIMERSGIEKAVYVGDTKGDYLAAKAANIPFIFAAYGFGAVEEAKIRVNAIEEILQIVENM